MKVLVKATHNILPDIEKEFNSEELPDVVGALIHYGYEVDNETLAAENNEMMADYDAECYYAEQERSIPNMRVDNEFKFSVEAEAVYPHPSYCRYK